MSTRAPLAALAFAACALAACGRPSADAKTPAEPAPAPAPVPKAAEAPAAPATEENPPVKDAAREVTLTARLAVEHRAGEGFEPVMPDRAPFAVKTGDRIHVALGAPGATHTYAIGARKQAHYRRLGAWGPGELKGDRLWPDGLVLDEAQADLDTLFVVASSTPLDWLDDLDTADCADLVGQMPPDPPKAACDHLYGLYWKVSSPRGMAMPRTEPIQMADGRNAIAVVAPARPGTPFSAVKWSLRSRP